MPESVAPSALAHATASLTHLSSVASSAEDDLLACLIVMGEPDAQRAVDGWVDQLVDLVRAVDEVGAAHVRTLSRVAVRAERAQVRQPVEQAPRARDATWRLR